MRNPRDFFKPLAIGAPEPLAEIPFTPSRMIHFLDFSNEKMVAKAPEIAPTVDILLGNLEDAVPVDRNTQSVWRKLKYEHGTFPLEAKPAGAHHRPHGRIHGSPRSR